MWGFLTVHNSCVYHPQLNSYKLTACAPPYLNDLTFWLFWNKPYVKSFALNCLHIHDSDSYWQYLEAIIFFGMGGGPKYTGGHKFFERKIGGHKIFDNQNVGSHKMTTDSVFILFEKTDFNTILACFGDKVYRWWGVRIFVAEMGGGRSFIAADLWKIWDPHFRRKG